MENNFRDFYIVLWVLLVVLWMLYPFMRLSFTSLLRKEGLSKTKIKELMAGKRNFWFYEAVAAQTDHRHMYFCNKAFLLSSIITSLLHAVIGWWKSASIVIGVLMCITCVAFAGIVAFSMMPLYTNYPAKKKDHRHNPATATAFVVFPLMMLIAVIRLLYLVWC
jgi:hypothetical protein